MLASVTNTPGFHRRCSVPRRNPYASRVGSTRESGRFTFRIVFDSQTVGVAEPTLVDLYVVAQGRQLVADGHRYAGLDHERVRRRRAYARSSDRLLDVHIEVDQVRQHLRRRLLDGTSAGGSYRNVRSPIAHDYDRTERVEALATGEDVEDIPRGIKSGPRNCVVEPDACAFWHYLATKDVAQSLCRADHVPLLIRDDEVRSVRLCLRSSRGRVRRCRIALWYAGCGCAERRGREVW